MTASGLPNFCRASSASASMKSTMPFTRACSSRSSTVPLRHSSSATRLSFLLHRIGKFDEPLGRVGPPIEQHVFDQFQQILRHLIVHGQLPGIDDAHVQPGANGVIQKCAVHRLADDVIAAKRKRNVADAAADFGSGRLSLIQCVARMKSTA